MRRAHSMPFGAEIIDGGVRFALWAPTAQEVSLVLNGRDVDMEIEDGGWRRVTLPEGKAGDRYGFRIDGGLVVPDPASRFQPEDVHKASMVADPRAYDWRDGLWTGRRWEEAVLYEVHVGTATPEGTYAALESKLQDLKDLGITALQIMPVSDFPGARNWGYDGVLPFAPEASYGTPEDLKRLIDRAHGLGLMVMLDVVYNHFGPSGNYLHAYAKSFFTGRHPTPWGDGINYDGTDVRPVRDFVIHNALYWLEEYHFDGLRLDAVHEIRDDSKTHILTELAERARAALPGREIHLVLENDANEASRLDRADDGRPRHYTAQWNDDLHHTWYEVLNPSHEGYYADYDDDPLRHLGRCLAEGFAYQGEPSGFRQGEPRGEPSAHLTPAAFIGFLQNHDQTGNRAFGERIGHLLDDRRASLAHAALLLSPNPPMLFMGEDWSASTPFLYFVDFADDPGLERGVREGRMREFGHIARAAEQNGGEVPDATKTDTFQASKLKWEERSREPHASILAGTRDLLAIRYDKVLPLLKSRFLGGRYQLPTKASLDVAWRFEAGTQRFVFNTAETPLTLDGFDETECLWSSRDAVFNGSSLLLPQWCGAMFRSA